MAVGASITVNTSRGEGQVAGSTSSEESKILKQILMELRKQNKETMIRNRKEESGLLKGGTGAALMRMLGLFGITTGGLGITAAAGSGLLNVGSEDTTGASYARVRLEGDTQDKIAAINTKTGEIVALYTEEEALRQGIVDKAGEIEENEATKSQINRTILANMQNIDGTYQLTDEVTDNILKYLSEIEKYNQLAAKYSKIYAERMRKKANAEREAVNEADLTDIRRINPGVGPMSIDPNSSAVAFARGVEAIRNKNEAEARDRLLEQIRTAGETQTSRTVDYFPFTFGGFNSGGNS